MATDPGEPNDAKALLALESAAAPASEKDVEGVELVTMCGVVDRSALGLAPNDHVELDDAAALAVAAALEVELCVRADDAELEADEDVLADSDAVGVNLQHS